MLLALLLACSAHRPVRHAVEPADVAIVQPTPTILRAERTLAAARERLASAQTALRVAEGAERAAEREREGAEADLLAAEAEVRAAEVNRDAARRAAALECLDEVRRRRVGVNARADWRSAERAARQARVAAGRAEVNLRRAELELERAEWLTDSGRSDDYVVSAFIAQRSRLRERWEDAVRREREAFLDAETARRRAGG